MNKFKKSKSNKQRLKIYNKKYFKIKKSIFKANKYLLKTKIYFKKN